MFFLRFNSADKVLFGLNNNIITQSVFRFVIKLFLCKHIVNGAEF